MCADNWTSASCRATRIHHISEEPDGGILANSEKANELSPCGADLLRQSVYSRLAGYENLNDAVRVSPDPTFRLIGSPKFWDRDAALTSTLHWFETQLLTRGESLVRLMAVNREVLAQLPVPGG